MLPLGHRHHSCPRARAGAAAWRPAWPACSFGPTRSRLGRAALRRGREGTAVLSSHPTTTTAAAATVDSRVDGDRHTTTTTAVAAAAAAAFRVVV